ncbi:MAG: metallophosphoesterase [Chthoniobacter sp.]|nr:metallophosphoesterase [Chthoniobacter sp.]
MSDFIIENSNEDHIDRRGYLKCMAWAGTGVLFSVAGGILSSRMLGGTARAAEPAAGASFNFVQISDSHIGFRKPANGDVAATFRETIARINALPQAPDFILHTGDLTQLSESKEFDDLQQMLKDCKTRQVFFVPGEHDVLADNGAQYLERFGKGTRGTGWFSFDQKGVHFIGLVNVATVKEGGLGVLGEEQLDWLQKDLAELKKSTPIVVFAHIPLWTIYPQWGWGTDDAARALAMLQPFGSVTVLNGHIHQTMQKVEGNITFHTACSTAFPQPAPGTAPKPGPMVVPAEKLRSYLGITSVAYTESSHSLAVIDSSLAAAK